MNLICLFFGCGMTYVALVDVDEILKPQSCGRPPQISDVAPQTPEEDFFDPTGFPEALDTPCEGWNACPCEADCQNQVIAECSDAVSPT